MDCSVSPLGTQLHQQRFTDSVPRRRWFPTSTPIQQKLDDSGYKSKERFTPVKRRCDFLGEIEENVLLDRSLTFISPNKQSYGRGSYVDKKRYSSKSGEVSNIDEFYGFSLEENDLVLYSDLSYELEDTRFTKDSSNEFSEKNEISDNFCTSSVLFSSPPKKSLFKSRKFLSASLIPYSPKRVDMIKELKKHNCYNVLANIFSYLSNKDLYTSSCVSQEWNKAISSMRSSNERKHSYVVEKHYASTGPNKENSGEDSKLLSDLAHKGCLKDLKNFSCSRNRILSSNSNLDISSLQVSPKIPGVKLVKCPSCSSASKVKGPRAICSKKRCKFEFCNKCFGPFSSSQKHHSCLLVSGEEKTSNNGLIMCSTKSKRNLRRL